MKGIGKPEPLSGDLQGEYSRRINEKDRLVYHMEDGRVGEDRQVEYTLEELLPLGFGPDNLDK